MISITKLNCAECKKPIEIETKYVKYRRNNDPNTKFYCSNECRNKLAGKNVTCFTCGKIFYKKPCELNSNGKDFCSQSCACTFNNSQRKYGKGKKKNHTCDVCNSISILSLNAISVCKNSKCEKFTPSLSRRERVQAKRLKKCFRCTNEFLGNGYGKFCPPCFKIRRSEAAAKSIASQSRRSKNEVYFSELCQRHFKDVKCNEPIFNGWDADVIIEDLKVAVLWNGNWHYQQIQKNISLKQIQTRDKIKKYQIINCGYTPYIIEDRGKYNQKFVEEQFQKFIAVFNTVIDAAG